MSLYPSLEDAKVDQIMKTQSQVLASTRPAAIPEGRPTNGAAPSAPPPSYSQSMKLYPAVFDYMGLDLSDSAIQQNMPVVYQSMQVVPRESNSNRQIAPVSGESVGIRQSEIRQGVRLLTVCKDANGKIGVKVKAMNKGVFVTFVMKGSPAALAGLRFGDQIIELNGEAVAGWDTERMMSALKKSPTNGIQVAVRDRPFERTVTLQRDSAGCVGILFSDGRITHIAKDTSAARNGVLTEHQLVEVNGQNVVGMKDKHVQKLFREAPENTVTITVMPCYVFDHIIKCIGDSLLKKMDHSVPDF